jgi:endonuclease IV
MKFKEMLEAFDKPYKWKREKATHGAQTYTFTTNKIVYDVVIDRYTDEYGKRYSNLYFDTGGSTDITGSGDAFRVFATILEIVKNAEPIIKDTSYLEFAADNTEISRVSLYKVMAKKLQKVLGYKYLKTYKLNG